MNVESNVCCMKISVCGLPSEPNIITDVVYYRGNLSVDYVVRWKWWLEYLAARIKVAHPRMKVVVYCGRQDVEVGREFHDTKRANLIRSVKIQLARQEQHGYENDLFGFNREEYIYKRCALVDKLAQLEADTYPIPELPEYINEVKLFTTKLL